MGKRKILELHPTGDPDSEGDENVALSLGSTHPVREIHWQKKI